MRGKVARELRKMLNYHPKNKREYMDFTFKVPRKILQFENDGEGGFKSKVVTRVVEQLVKECVSGDRKLYKYFKKKYVNNNHEEQFNALPEQGELDVITKQFQEELRASKGRGVPSENESDNGETNSEG